MLAHAWFCLLAPVTDDLELAKRIVALQLEQTVWADMLLVQVSTPLRNITRTLTVQG